MNKRKVIILSLVILFTVSCNSKSNNIVDNNPKKQSVLVDIGNSIILKTYEDMDIAVTELMNSIDNFVVDSTDENLQAVREKWVASRKPWETSEGFLFGPADTKGLDPSLDSWPVDVNAMKSVVDSDEVINPELLAKNDDARGFHLIEYLAWGNDGNAKASDFNLRTLEYLKAAGQDLQKNTQDLYDSWKPEGGNYVANLIEAQQGEGVYKKDVVALEEITGAIIAICDEVGNGKITTPLNIDGGFPKPEEEESRFSHNSKQDFQDNIQSVYNVYNGMYKTFKGKGLSELTKLKDTELDTRIKNLINEALASIKDIPGTFSQAIRSNRTEVENAIKKINELQKVLEEELNPLLKSL